MTEKKVGDIYDSAFRTILNDCRQLILPVINEAFGEKYTGKEKIEFYPNEHFIEQEDSLDKKRITDTNFIVKGETEKKYHWECQSSSDSKMLIRLFEYDAQIALDQGEFGTETLTVEFPNSAVLYLRCKQDTPDKYKYVIKTPGGNVEYEIPIMKIKSYTSEDIFKKNLLLFIPFYIFTFENHLAKCENDENELEKLKDEYRKIVQKLEDLTKSGVISGFDCRVIIRLADEVLKTLAKKYEKVREGVDDIMSGPLIDIPERKVVLESKYEFAKKLLIRGKYTIEEIAEDTELPLSEIEKLAKELKK